MKNRGQFLFGLGIAILSYGAFGLYMAGEWAEVQEKPLQWFLETPHVIMLSFLLLVLPFAVFKLLFTIDLQEETQALWKRFSIVFLLPYVVVITYLAAEWGEIEESWLTWLVKPSHFLIVLINGLLIPVILWRILTTFIQLWEEREKHLRRIMELENELRSFVHPEVYRRIYEKSDLGSRGAFKIVMADMQSFTQFCELHNAQSVAVLADEFCNLMDARIRGAGGITLSYAGDLVFALFDETADSRVIIETAEAMQADFAEYASKKFPDWNTRLNIGIHFSKDIVLGTVGGGSAQKHFTANGFGVCEVSRMCSDADHGQLLISEDFFKTLRSRNMNWKFKSKPWKNPPKNITNPPALFELVMTEEGVPAI